MDVLIRDATLDDAADLQAYCLPMNSVEQVRDGIRECLTAPPEAQRLYLVAEVDGHAVGQVVLIWNEHALRAHRVEVAGLVVARQYTRRGIARRLVEACRARGAARGIAMLEVAARGGEPAEEVYRRLGFIEWGHLPGGLREPWGEQRVYDEVRFYMRVAG